MKTIAISLIIFIANCLTISAQHNDKKNDIEEYIDRFNKNELAYNNNGWAHYFIPKGAMDTLTVKMSCVYTGNQTHPPHSHYEDEAFLIISGPVIFHINNEERTLNSGDLIYTPSESSHNIQRINNDTIRYLVIKRETLHSLDKPYKVANINYTFDDCYFPNTLHCNKNRKQTILLDDKFTDGLQITINKLSEGEYYSSFNQLDSQNAIYILSGKSIINYLNQETIISQNNTFFCPKSNNFTINNQDKEDLVFIMITTKT